jgi:hypothetical protein
VSLFGSIARVFSPIAGTIIGAHANKKAISKANAATQLGITNAKGDLNSQLASSMAGLSPNITAGHDALSGIRDLLGLDGADAQASGIAGLEGSPLFASLMRNGQDILRNNASATGGLRGGNFQRGLADFSADTLAQVIQQQLQGYSGLATQGLGATEFGAGLGQNNANALAGLDNQSGQQNALAITNKNTVSNNMFDQLQKLVTSAVSGGAGGGFNLASLFGGSSGGSAAPYAGVGPIGSYGPPSTPMTLPFGGKYDFGPGLPF